jgi:hypothetical protein
MPKTPELGGVVLKLPYYCSLHLREWRRVTSGLTTSRRFFLVIAPELNRNRSGETVIQNTYGIAKLLPLIVPVKS